MPDVKLPEMFFKKLYTIEAADLNKKSKAGHSYGRPRTEDQRELQLSLLHVNSFPLDAIAHFATVSTVGTIHFGSDNK